MIRHAWTLFAVTCVCLLVCALALWYFSIGSYACPFHWTTHGGPTRGGDDCQIVISQNRLSYRLVTEISDGHRPSWYPSQRLPGPERQELSGSLVRRGFSWHYELDVLISMIPPGQPPPMLLSRDIEMPMWFATTLLAIPPLAWIAVFIGRRVAGRRNRRGFTPILNASAQGAA